MSRPATGSFFVKSDFLFILKMIPLSVITPGNNKSMLTVANGRMGSLSRMNWLIKFIKALKNLNKNWTAFIITITSALLMIIS